MNKRNAKGNADKIDYTFYLITQTFGNTVNEIEIEIIIQNKMADKTKVI